MGTTSFRTADFNQKIERQLTLLSKFWEVHTDVVWSGNDEIQSLYYDFMKDNDFLTGDAPNKPKDAREKTSGLIDLGLIDNERRPTAAGESLRQITSNGDFRPNNLLQIPADSYIYFKQMLKTSNDVDGEIVRPFVVLVLALKQLEYLTQEEFTYLLPLITTSRKFRSMCTYKSYCWSMGTTSFRTADFNQKIERQLTLLSKFWEVHTDVVWSGNDEIQSLYYDFMKDNDFLTGDAPNKPKDAREKTSGLIDLGLIDNERRPTAAGESLRQITSNGDFRPNNLLQIPADSYIYFKQMLKTSNDVDGEIVRPFVVLVLALKQLEYLTQEEFTYLLPLITTSRKFRTIVDCIKRLRKGDITIDEIIVDTLLTMENYREARLYLLERPVSEHVICQAGINRKSRQYDSTYYPLYRTIESLDRNNAQSILDLLQACRNIRIGALWCNHLFKTTNRGKIKKLLSASLNDVPILNCRNEFELKDRFFRLMHLFKVKANLSDYFDLNRRYFGTTDTVLFKDNRVELSPIPKCFFDLCAENLEEIAFTTSPLLPLDCDIEKIIPRYDIEESDLHRKLADKYGLAPQSLSDIRAFLDDECHERFNRLIDARFPDHVLLELLSDFETRNDINIRRLVTDNADVPTIFEYIVGIVWYKVSNRKGRILDYFNLSLDADLLPKTHAAGGMEDITYRYNATPGYPEHTLLIEATLAEAGTQRRMEMEPVSRHLGDFLLRDNRQEAYALFVTPFLHLNVISDFRGRKQMPYYSSDGEQCINGMKIIPLNTAELKNIIANSMTYDQLYPLFECAHQNNEPPKTWYENNIMRSLQPKKTSTGILGTLF